MDLTQMFLPFVLTGAISMILSSVFHVAVFALFYVIEARDISEIAALDAYLRIRGICSVRRISGEPTDGLHFAFMRGPIVARRSTGGSEQNRGSQSSYRIYVIGRAARAKLHALLAADKGVSVETRYVYSPTTWRTESVTVPQRHRQIITRDWQNDLVKTLLTDYERTNHASAIVMGKPGIGKSTIGYLVTLALGQEKGVRPVLVANLDLTTRGLLYDDVVRPKPSREAPVVLMLDEYDQTVRHAERVDKSGKGESVSHAESKASLTGLLDRLAISDYVIVIATTNDVELLKEKSFRPYTRKGRFDHHCDLRGVFCSLPSTSASE